MQLVFGTPEGDQQDQWQLIWFLRFVHFGLGLQECMDAPLFHSMHFQGSFYPRAAAPGEMMIEASFGETVIEDLRARSQDHGGRAMDGWPPDGGPAGTGWNPARGGDA